MNRPVPVIINRLWSVVAKMQNIKFPQLSRSQVRLVVLSLAICVSILWALDFCLGWSLPGNVELIVSRCKEPRLRGLSPDGRHMIVVLGHPSGEVFLVNIATDEWTRLTNGTHHFVTNDLVLGWPGYFAAREGVKPYILDLRDGSQTPLNRLDVESDWQASFAETETVFLVVEASTGLALAPDFKNNPGRNFALGNPYGSNYGGVQGLEAMLVENGILFQRVEATFRLCHYDEGCVSHDGLLVAEGTEIYTLNGQLVASKRNLYKFTIYENFSGWAHDDSGVYFGDGGKYLIEGEPFPPLFHIPDPILKLRTPEEYLHPMPTP